MKCIRTLRRKMLIRQYHEHMYYVTWGGRPKDGIPIWRFYRAARRWEEAGKKR